MKPRVICWDLDETLGNFRPVADELLAELERFAGLRRLAARIGIGRRAEAGPSVTLREGIREVLEALAARGFVQVVTTGAFREYAVHGLRTTGLIDLFDAVFARDVIWAGWGKAYAPVRERYDVAPEQMLIIGDDFKKDRASDHLDTVMICDPPGWGRPAAPLLPLVEALAAEEAGTFRAGFDRLRASATRDGLSSYVSVGNVRASIGFWGNFQNGDITPVLSEISPVGVGE